MPPYDQGQVVMEFHKSGTGDLNAGDLSHRYLWGPAVDQLLADEQVDWSDSDADGEVLWALTDHLGSVRDVVDSNGDLRIHRDFDTFGNVTNEQHLDTSGSAVTAGQTGYVDVAFAFTGRYFDTDTGLQNNLNRWYDPATGRWISEDPIGFAAGDPNLYRYVGNSPTMRVDPTGLHYIVDPPFFPPPKHPWETPGRPGAVPPTSGGPVLSVPPRRRPAFPPKNPLQKEAEYIEACRNGEAQFSIEYMDSLRYSWGMAEAGQGVGSGFEGNNPEYWKCRDKYNRETTPPMFRPPRLR